jgi:hypothetical protein
MNRTVLSCAAVAAIIVPVLGQPFSYNEFVDGDLSNDLLNPTDLGPAGLGVNSVRLSVFESTTPGGDFDVFTFEIQGGQEMAGLLLLDYLGSDEIAYLAIAAGPVFPVNPNDNPSDFLGGALIGPPVAGIGSDYFPLLQLPFAGGTGFSGNLGAGSYSIFVQQTGEYTELELGIVVIPAPGSIAALGLLGLVGVRRRR